MYTTREEKKRRKFRALYELLFNDYRIPDYRISKKLHFRSVSKVIKKLVKINTSQVQRSENALMQILRSMCISSIQKSQILPI